MENEMNVSAGNSLDLVQLIERLQMNGKTEGRSLDTRHFFALLVINYSTFHRIF